MNSASAPLGSRRLFINDKRAQEWITRRFGLFTDDNSQTLNGEAINFDWVTQRWYITLPG